LCADVDASSNEENLTTRHNNAVEVDVAVKAVVNITLTGLVDGGHDDDNDNTNSFRSPSPSLL